MLELKTTKGDIVREFLGKHWRKITVAAICLPVVGYLVLGLAIGHGVRGAVSNAQTQFPGDPVSALITVATDEQADISERNQAIWALGQLGSTEALPALQAMVTEKPCDHDKLICQKEVASAIEACSGATNIGWVIWRHGDLAVASNNDRLSP